MQLVALGLNHHTAPLAIREQLAFPAEQLADAARPDRSHPRTRRPSCPPCNRTEIYAGAENIDAVLHWLARNRGWTWTPYGRICICWTPKPPPATLSHGWLRAGFHGVGRNPDCHGQIKDAVRAAEQCGALGVLLNALSKPSPPRHGRCASQTAIGANSVSMAAAGVKLAWCLDLPSIPELMCCSSARAR